MSREDIIAVASRLFAFFLLVVAVRSGSLVFAVSNIDTGSLALTIVAGVIVPLAVAGLLWFFPLGVARKLLPVMRTEGATLSTDRAGLMEVGCTVLGLWLLASGLSQGLPLGLYLVAIEAQGYRELLSSGHIAPIGEALIEVIIALWLLLGYEGVIGAIRRFRMAGIRG